MWAGCVSSFVKAFFSNPNDVQLIEYPKGNDRFLRFYDMCPRYDQDVVDNDAAKVEAETFKASELMQKNIVALKKVLNLPEDADVSFTDVASAYSACA